MVVVVHAPSIKIEPPRYADNRRYFIPAITAELPHRPEWPNVPNLLLGLIRRHPNYNSWAHCDLSPYFYSNFYRGPIGGHDLDLPGTAQNFIDSLQSAEPRSIVVWESALEVTLVLTTSLTGTIMLMIPITWMYMASKHAGGY